MAGRLFTALLLLHGVILVNAAGSQSEFPALGTSSSDHVPFHATISARLITTLFASERSQQEPVQKTIFGAQINGNQSTTTTVRAELAECTEQIRIDLKNNGTVTSRTSGITPQALVENSGRHQFQITKPVYFDGQSFRTQRAYGIIQASQVPIRVQSSASGVPIIGPVADRIAWSEVMRMSPQIADAVAKDLSTDILPKVDSATDAELVRLNTELAERLQIAKRFSVLKDYRLRTSSTADSAYLSLMPRSSESGSSEIQTTAKPSWQRSRESSPADDVVLEFSDTLAESLLLEVLFPGRLITDREMKNPGLLLTPQKSDSQRDTSSVLDSTSSRTSADGATGDGRWTDQGETSDPEIDSTSAELFSIQLAEERPVSVAFRNGEIQLSVNFQVILRTGQKSGWHSAGVRVEGTNYNKEEWGLRVSDASVVTLKELESEDSEAEKNNASLLSGLSSMSDTAWATLIKTSINRMTEPTDQVRFRRNFEIPRKNKAAVRLQLHRIQSEENRLSMTYRMLDKPE
ncbi:MAG: hypothetical protein ACK526_02745 [Planctomyces sp.]